MKNLQCLIEGISNINIKDSIVIKGLAMDSRRVEKGFLFFAVPGLRDDGTKYVDDALKKGAVAVVVQEDYKNENVPVIKVRNVRKIIPVIAKRFYDDPSSDLEVIGITGTNGKTTTTYILKHLLTGFDKNTGVIGTVQHIIAGKVLKSLNTTPESIDINKMLKDHLNYGGKAIAMEVSSHSISMHRVDGVKFDGTIFTNLTRDHLDFHKDMNEYFNVKSKLFKDLSKDFTIKVINIDDEYGRKLYSNVKGFKYSYGKSEDANLYWEVDKLSLSGSTVMFILDGKKYPVFLSLPAYHNIYNFAGAFLYMVKKGYDPDRLIELAASIPPVKGRLETIEHDGKYFIVDYAHTPDALKNVLIGIREISKGRIITVFGAGGDRDRGKRPEMGKIADKLSDVVVVTSDNPRTEDPMKIIEDIKEGISRDDDLYIIPDRKEAISRAISLARAGDVVLVSGKGHEDYQILKDKTIHFSDMEVIKEVLKL